MEKWKAEQLAHGAKGQLIQGDGKTGIQRVIIDSRKAQQGDAFFAIIGETQDGHIYAQSAAEQGASVLVLHQRETAEKVMQAAPEAVVILVEDTTRALQDFAEWHLNRWPVKKIAVTGSTGKTTTKEMLHAIFSQKFKTLKNIGNFNNHIGLPLTILELTEDMEAAIFEMGMSQFGEIHRLADIVRPDVALITNIGTSHIEYLKTRDNILKAKLEITDFFQENHVLIVNSDNDKLTLRDITACITAKQEENEQYKGRFQMVTAGEKLLDDHQGQNGKADFYLNDMEDHGEDGISFAINHDHVTQQFRLPLLGMHNGTNAALAVAAGTMCGISMEEAARGLATMENTGRRLQSELVKLTDGDLKLIDDSYNASPDSMMAGLDVLMSVPGNRKIAMLADILEMGDSAEEYHRKVGAYAAEKKVDVLIAVGINAKFIAEEAERLGGKFTAVIYHETREPLIRHLDHLLQAGDVVLVKGSNGMKMAEVTNKIRSL